MLSCDEQRTFPAQTSLFTRIIRYSSKMSSSIEGEWGQKKSDVSELVSVLGDITLDDRQHQAASRVIFPSYISDALLRCDFTADSQQLTRLVATLDQNRERIRDILHRDSLRLLAYVLLNSDDAIEQQSGLHLLLDGPTQANQVPLSSSDHMPSIRYKLITVLFCIFLDKGRAIQCRRLAGKLIVALMTESSETGSPILQAKDLANYCPRIVSIFCHEKDAALKFFAGDIIRSLRSTGTSEGHLWKSREPKYRSIFFECLRKYPNDWIRSFHSYTSEVEHYESRGARASSRSERSGTIKQSSCHLIGSVAIGPQTYSGPAILALSTSDCVIFIFPGSDYIEMPVQYISEPIHHVPKRRRGPSDAPSLEFEATGGVLLNGRQLLSKASISIVSDKDLSGLRDVLTDARSKAQKQGRATRRVSSTIVALDTAEEVTTKSSQCRDSSSQAFNHEVGSSADKDHGSRGESIAETSNAGSYELRAMSDLTREASRPEESSRITIEDVEILAGALSESEIPTSQEHGDKSPGKKISFPYDATDSPKKYVTSPIAEANPAEHITEPETADAASKRSQPKRSGVSNRRGTQKKPPLRRSARGRALSNRKDRRAIPNTQESLLFPRMGRPSKKIYTSRSKRAVDWEEDLRPTEDDEEAARAVQNDSQLTSVSSPSPGDTSIFSKRPNAAQKKRKARAAPSLAKGKRSAKKKVTSVNRRGRTPRLPLQTKEPNVDNGNEGTSTGHEAEKTTNDLNGSTGAGNNTDSRPHNHEDKENTFGLAAKPDDISFALRMDQLPSVVQGSRSPSEDTCVKRGAQADATNGAGQRREEAGAGNVHMNFNEQPSTDRMMVSQKSPQQTEFWINQNSRFSPVHDEQALMEGPLPEQGLELPNEYGTQQSESDKLQGIGDFQALFISQENEIGRLSMSIRDRAHDTPAEAVTDGNRDGAQSKPEERLLARSRKRAAIQSTTEENPNKKSQLTFATSGDQKLHQLEDAVERDRTSRQSNIDSSSSASIVERSTSPLSDSQSRSALEQMGGKLSEQTTTPEGPSRMILPASSQKKSIVDENGSPRLVPRHASDNHYFQATRVRRLRLEQWRHSLEDARSGYHGDSDDDSLESSASVSTSNSSSPERNVGSFKGGRLDFRSATILAGDANEARHCSSRGLCLPDDNTRGQPAKNSDQHVESMITPYSVSGIPTHRAESADTASRGLSSATTIQLPQEPTQLGIQVEEGPCKANWQASLEAMQKTTHELLLHTSERLTHQLEHEKGTISQVLDSYRQGCHQVMNQLFKAHEERIELYRQQMQSVRKQHSDLCQDLIRRLEENDRRIQERLCSGV